MKYIKIILISFFLLSLAGCSKEKAEALKVAAANFKNEAVLALNGVSYLFAQSRSVVLQSEQAKVDSIIGDLKSISDGSDISSALLNHWAAEDKLGEIGLAEVDSAFGTLRNQYEVFSSMFNNLPRGSLFALEEVRKAEKHAINLTIQLINLSRLVQENDFVFTGRRVLIVERMKRAHSEKNTELQEELYKSVAQDFVQLLKDEERSKDEVVRQCLKSAESGRLVADLIKDYQKLNVAQVLNLISNSMNFAMEVTNGNQDVSNLLDQFNAAKAAIEEDPYWKVILEQEIND